MKALTLPLPDSIVAKIALESQARRLSKSDIVRERRRPFDGRGTMRELLGEFNGSVQGPPPHLAGNKKKYLAV